MRAGQNLSESNSQRPDVIRRTTCRICDGADLALLFSLGPTPLANQVVPASQLDRRQAVYPLDVYMCGGCRHVQLLDVVDPEILFRDYVYVSGTSPVFVDHFRAYAAAVVAMGVPPGALVVDVGSNDGTLLRCFLELGMRVLGVDPATDIARRATESGIETLPVFFTTEVAADIARRYGAAAVVTANNVFAHADDLIGFLESVRDVLAPDGVFVFEVSYLLDVYEKLLFDTIYHEHVSYHAVKPLVTLFERAGMELVDARRVTSHGGSLRGIAQKRGGGRTRSRAVDDLIEAERAAGVHDPEPFRRYYDRIQSRGRELRSLLADLRAQGRRVAGFGAPAKATTLMYTFGLGPQDLEFIVDQSPLKQGLFTPGQHIPIVPAARLDESPPDYVLILAWNFADSIIAGQARFTGRGGRFIVPLPDLAVRPS